jgi:hypothetical protein
MRGIGGQTMRDRLIVVFTHLDENISYKEEYGILFDTPFVKAVEDVLQMLKGVTVQEWISVKDRLPEKWQNVLAVRSDGKMRFDFICSTGCWCEDVNYVGYSVTHWMPLPQPPKGE